MTGNARALEKREERPRDRVRSPEKRRRALGMGRVAVVVLHDDGHPWPAHPKVVDRPRSPPG
jgi:hypothetical protein